MSSLDSYGPAAPCCWGLYTILDRRISGRPHEEAARLALEGGARVIQLRDKHASFEELLTVARRLRQLTGDFNATFLVNDNPYLAAEVEADGVHLGQEDCPVSIARDILGPDAIIGLSTHSRQQAMAACTLPVNYIGFGPIYETTSKQSSYEPLGLESLRWVVAAVQFPVVAIGGIQSSHLPALAATKVQNFAGIQTLMGSPDIREQARKLIEVFRSAAAVS